MSTWHSSLAVGSLVLLAACALGATPDGASSGGRQAASWSKTIHYEHEAEDVTYSVRLAVAGRDTLKYEIEFTNNAREPAFLLVAEPPDSRRERRVLHIFVGAPQLYHESAVPRLRIVKPDTTLRISSQLTCAGPCATLNYVDLTFFFLAHEGAAFFETFSSLDGDKATWFVTDPALWEQYYQNLETETVLFTLLPVTD